MCALKEKKMLRKAYDAKTLNHYTNYSGELEYDTYSVSKGDLGVELFANKDRVGYIRGQLLDYKNYEELKKMETCYSDVYSLAEQAGSSVCEKQKGTSCLLPRVFMITDVELDSYDNQGTALRGLGLGKLLYETVFTEVHRNKGDFIAVPMHCILSGNTSSDAKRVWKSLARTLVSSNDSVLVDYEINF